MAGLETDVTTINSDVTGLEDRTSVVEGEIAVISAAQVLQDEIPLELEINSDGQSQNNRSTEQRLHHNISLGIGQLWLFFALTQFRASIKEIHSV